VPCTSGTLQITVTIRKNSRLEQPKHSVIAEIYPITPEFVQERPVQTKERKRVKRKRTEDVSPSNSKSRKKRRGKLKSAEARSAPISQEFTPFNGAEFKQEPNLSPILPEDPLPNDLQDLVNRCKKITDSQKRQVEAVLRKNHDVFAKDSTSFGLRPRAKFRSNTQDHPPIKQNARPVPIHYRKAVYDTIMKYLECGALVSSQSPWASPILCVPKKNQEVRVCIDYRRLNAVTQVPAIPIPRTKEILQKMAGHRIYHTFDLTSGYHNLEIHPEDQPKTAIIEPDEIGLPFRQYNFTRLGFGLASAPGFFQQIKDRLVAPAKKTTLENDIGPFAAVYLDDICIAGEAFQEMLNRQTAMFNQVRAAGFLLKAKKCEIFQESVSYLGHEINHRGIQMDPNKLTRIQHWPAPATQKELKTVLGCITYYNSFIKNFA